MKLYQDIESRSPIDLTKCGVYVYASHPLTEITMWSYAVDDAEIKTWYPFFNESIPADLENALLDKDVILCAHNASFERIMMSLASLRNQPLLKPEVIAALKPITRWHCTAAKAASAGLPRTLEGSAKAIGLSAQKDIVGHRLMLKLCKPRGTDSEGNYVWYEDPDDVRREGVYCEQDVRVERNVDQALPDLSEFEYKIWCLTETINDRGIAADDRLVAYLANFVDEAERDLNIRLRITTCPLHQDNDQRACEDPIQCKMLCGAVPKVTNPQKIKNWMIDQGYDDITGVGKDIIAQMLELDNLLPIVREVLTMRHDGGKSSTSKYKTILNRINSDGRLRGNLIYCGAYSTGRFSSTGTQLQNLVRGGNIPNLLDVVDEMLTGTDIETVRTFFGPPLIVASELLRPIFIAPEGYWLARGDYSQIEARVIAWLAGESRVIEAFKEYDTILGLDAKGKPIRKGPDIYRIAGSGIYGIPPLDLTDEQRQVGKAGTLALGFGGGVGAFQRMAKLNNVKVPDEKAEEIKLAWRESNPNIVQLWADMGAAAFDCVRGGYGTKIEIRPNMWFARSRRGMGLRMPSGRSLMYWYPKIEKVEMPWGIQDSVTCYVQNSVTKQFSRESYYGGIFAQNVTQALARDILAYALLVLEERGLFPVLNVHDEAICQVPKKNYPLASDAANAVKSAMLCLPPWCAGTLPVACDASAGPRYVKA